MTKGIGMTLAAIAAAIVMMDCAALQAASCSGVFYNGRPKDNSANELKNHPQLKVCCVTIPSEYGPLNGPSLLPQSVGCVATPSDCARQRGNLGTGGIVHSEFTYCDKPFTGYKPSGL